MKTVVATVFLVILGIVIAFGANIPLYHLVPIAGEGSRAYAVNDHNEVVGTYVRGYSRPFYWSKRSGLIELEQLGPLNMARAINNAGHIGGWTNRWATIWSPDGQIKTLGIGFVMDINNRGAAVGFSDFRACRWQNGSLTFLAGLNSQANAINDWGEAVGYIQKLGRKYAWSSRIGELPYIWGINSICRDINNQGTIVGDYEVNGQTHCFIRVRTGYRMPIGPGSAYGINERHEVVGADATGAWIWNTRFGKRNLNNLLDSSGAGWHLTAAYAINESGSICGTGTNGAYLLVPNF